MTPSFVTDAECSAEPDEIIASGCEGTRTLHVPIGSDAEGTACDADTCCPTVADMTVECNAFCTLWGLGAGVCEMTDALSCQGITTRMGRCRCQRPG